MREPITVVLRTNVALALACSCLAAPLGGQIRYQARVIDSVAGGGVTVVVAASTAGFAQVDAHRTGTEIAAATMQTFAELLAAADSIDVMLHASGGSPLPRKVALSSHGLRLSTPDGRTMDLQLGSVVVPLTPASAARLAKAFRTAARVGQQMQAQDRAERARAQVGAIYFEYQVQKPAALLPGNPRPRYPDMLRSAGVGGEVLAQFVVDTAGRVEDGSFKALQSSHDLFTAAVKQILPSLRFSPARIRGRAVRQLVMMPFTFP